jgi:hypothetical protein
MSRQSFEHSNPLTDEQTNSQTGTLDGHDYNKVGWRTSGAAAIFAGFQTYRTPCVPETWGLEKVDWPDVSTKQRNLTAKLFLRFVFLYM